jgi:hypothetical protein
MRRRNLKVKKHELHQVSAAIGQFGDGADAPRSRAKVMQAWINLVLTMSRWLPMSA